MAISSALEDIDCRRLGNVNVKKRKRGEGKKVLEARAAIDSVILLLIRGREYVERRIIYEDSLDGGGI